MGHRGLHIWAQALPVVLEKGRATTGVCLHSPMKPHPHLGTQSTGHMCCPFHVTDGLNQHEDKVSYAVLTTRASFWASMDPERRGGAGQDSQGPSSVARGPRAEAAPRMKLSPHWGPSTWNRGYHLAQLHLWNCPPSCDADISLVLLVFCRKFP